MVEQSNRLCQKTCWTGYWRVAWYWGKSAVCPILIFLCKTVGFLAENTLIVFVIGLVGVSVMHKAKNENKKVKRKWSKKTEKLLLNHPSVVYLPHWWTDSTCVSHFINPQVCRLQKHNLFDTFEQYFNPFPVLQIDGWTFLKTQHPKFSVASSLEEKISWFRLGLTIYTALMSLWEMGVWELFPRSQTISGSFIGFSFVFFCSVFFFFVPPKSCMHLYQKTTAYRIELRSLKVIRSCLATGLVERCWQKPP